MCAQESGNTGALTDTISKFYESIEAGDPEIRIPLLAEDVILMPNHWTIMSGKETVAESFRRSAEAVFRIRDREVIQMQVGKDLAYTVNSYYYTYHLKGDQEQWHRTKNVHIWRRDPSGAWKLAVDIWNSDVPIGQFAEE
jgi:ketosteroid isomerase-like protein